MVPEASKRCVTCRETKEHGGFAKNRSRPDGLQARCRACTSTYYRKNADRVKARVKAYRLSDPERSRDRSRAWREANPEKARKAQHNAYMKRADYYRERAREYYADHRDEFTESNREWVDRNRDKVRATKARYKHKRRALENASEHRVTGSDLKRVFNRSGECAYCGLRFGSFSEATWDHIVPVTRGGSFGIGNIAPACGKCNSSKNNKTLMEWRVWKRRHGLVAL